MNLNVIFLKKCKGAQISLLGLGWNPLRNFDYGSVTNMLHILTFI